MEIFIDNFDITEFDEKTGCGKLSITCSKGTYIRTLIHDLGQELGCGAVMTALVRTAACGFTLSDCYTLDEIQKIADEGKAETITGSCERLFDGYPSLQLSRQKAAMYRNGVKLRLNELKGYGGEEFLKIYSDSGEFIGIARSDMENGVLRVLKNLSGGGEP